MAVPKRKTSPSKRNMRRSHDALKRKQLVLDETGEYKLPHHTSLNGQYKNRQIVPIKRKNTDETSDEESDNA